MVSKTYLTICSECGYEEESTVDIEYSEDDSTGISCPNCDEGDMIVLKKI